ncbi:hypothetical protein ACFX2J_006102 [Malus domestica]
MHLLRCLVVRDADDDPDLGFGQGFEDVQVGIVEADVVDLLELQIENSKRRYRCSPRRTAHFLGPGFAAWCFRMSAEKMQLKVPNNKVLEMVEKVACHN